MKKKTKVRLKVNGNQNKQLIKTTLVRHKTKLKSSQTTLKQSRNQFPFPFLLSDGSF